MAKTKMEKTPVQIAADKAREHYAKAKEAVDKNDNATTQKAFTDAKAARDKAVAAERRERFERVGGLRVSNALNAINNVGKLNATSSYSYTENDVAKLEQAIMDSVKNAVSSLRSALAGGSKTADKKGFSF